MSAPIGGEPLFAVTAVSGCILTVDHEIKERDKNSKNSKAVCGLFFPGKIHLQNECWSHVGISLAGKE